MNKCSGCGAILQCENQNKEGYVKQINSSLCERCFRIINYNEYQKIEKNNDEFVKILEQINKTGDLVLLVIDLLNINKDLSFLLSKLQNDILAVYTKRDLLPLLIKDDKLLSYGKKLKLKLVDSVIVSSVNNYNLDLLLEKINKYKKSDKIYVVGYSNTGKSTLINKMIYNYSNSNSKITTSMLPSTTIDTIEIKLNDEITLIDTPGILEEGNIAHFVDNKTLKKIQPKKEIRPITYQIKAKQIISIDDLAILELENKNNLTFYVSNQLEIKRFFKPIKTDLEKQVIRVKEGEDIVISGLGFIKVSNSDTINIYTLKGISVYTRKSLI